MGAEEMARGQDSWRPETVHIQLKHCVQLHCGFESEGTSRAPAEEREVLQRRTNKGHTKERWG